MTAAAESAIKLDPNDGESHLVLATAYAYAGKLDKVAPELDRAEALSPNNADVKLLVAWELPYIGKPEHAAQLADEAVRLNPNYPDWYNQGLRHVYFFARQFEKSLDATKRIREPFALDYAFLAMSNAYLGHDADAKSAAAEVLRLDLGWSAEQWISSQGGFARDEESNLFADGAKKAGLPMCASEATLKAQSNLLRLKACNQERAKGAAG